ncbi:MAG: 3-demethylubiquinone-9 3-methyltransferase [Phenylobacterium sp.]|nr:3-demethylubiquinone-9 3-methyltransferase [Phenylobacterium sp.]
MQKVIPFLWFDTEAEEAALFYTSLFPNSKIGRTVRYGASGPGPAGSVMTVQFELDGQSFVGLNGGPIYKFSPAVSFQIDCKDQAEVDHYWNAFAAGGREVQCGWITDRFGLSWQVVPEALPRLMSDPDPAKAGRVAQAMMKMVKLDVAKLEAAAAG